MSPITGGGICQCDGENSAGEALPTEARRGQQPDTKATGRGQMESVRHVCYAAPKNNVFEEHLRPKEMVHNIMGKTST